MHICNKDSIHQWIILSNRHVVQVGLVAHAKNLNNFYTKILISIQRYKPLYFLSSGAFYLRSLRSGLLYDSYSVTKTAAIMAIALEIIANVVIGVLSVTIPLAIEKSQEGAQDTVGVEIGVGAPSHFDNAASLGGNIPKVTLFDEYGQVWGRWQPKKNEKIDPGMVWNPRQEAVPQ